MKVAITQFNDIHRDADEIPDFNLSPIAIIWLRDNSPTDVNMIPVKDYIEMYLKCPTPFGIKEDGMLEYTKRMVESEIREYREFIKLSKEDQIKVKYQVPIFSKDESEILWFCQPRRWSDGLIECIETLGADVVSGVNTHIRVIEVPFEDPNDFTIDHEDPYKCKTYGMLNNPNRCKEGICICGCEFIVRADRERWE